MGELELMLSRELTDAACVSGNELLLPYAKALQAIVIATRQQIPVLGPEAFEARKNGLFTVNVADTSSYTVFTGDWKAYVAMLNAEAERWLKEHRLGENHGYILTSASESEFVVLKVCL